MIQRATTSDPVLDRITQPIVERFQPIRIVLFGSRARGDARPDSDYDVMVELPVVRDEHECRRALSAAVGSTSETLNWFIRAAGEFRWRADDPGTVDYAAAREGILLYARDGTPRGPLAPPPARIRENRGEAGIPFSTWEWARAAERDLSSLDNQLQSSRPEWSYVCFHAQQAAEKYLKAAIAARRAEDPPRSHDLEDLVHIARDAGGELPDLVHECELLKNYAVTVRYPGGECTESEARAAVEASQRIVEAAKKVIEAARTHGSR